MESFQGKLHGYLSAYFVDNSGAVTKREDCFETIIPLAFQQLAEDMTDEIVTYLHFHVLYARTSNDGSVCHVALYSRPFEHEMAVVMMNSLQHGLIDSIRVRFFFTSLL